MSNKTTWPWPPAFVEPQPPPATTTEKSFYLQRVWPKPGEQHGAAEVYTATVVLERYDCDMREQFGSSGLGYKPALRRVFIVEGLVVSKLDEPRREGSFRIQDSLMPDSFKDAFRVGSSSPPMYRLTLERIEE